MSKLNEFFISNGTINVKLLESDPVKPVNHAADFKKMFPDKNNVLYDFVFKLEDVKQNLSQELLKLSRSGNPDKF